MFSHLIIFNPEHKEKFVLPWIAATRGVQYLEKRQILSADTEELCRNLKQFIKLEVKSQAKRFSLRISAILINGIVKIRHQTVLYLEHDVLKAVQQTSIPLGLQTIPDESGLFDTPPTPKTKSRAKKRKPSITKETPDDLLEFMQLQLSEEIEQVDIRARADEITLHEEITHRTTQDLLEDLGEFGSIADTLQFQEFIEAESLFKSPVHVEVPISPQPNVLTTPPIERHISGDSSSSASASIPKIRKLTPPAKGNDSAEIIFENLRKEKPVPFRKRRFQNRYHKIKIDGNNNVVPQELLLDFQTKLKVNINRSEFNLIKLREELPVEDPSCRLKKDSLVPLFSDLSIEFDTSYEIERPRRSINDSLRFEVETIQKKRSVDGTPVRMVPDVVEKVAEVKLDNRESVERISDENRKRMKKDSILQEASPLRSNLIVEEIPELSYIEANGDPKVEAQLRQQKIIHYLKNCDNDVTIEDIVQPLNKLTVARAFADLLHLCGTGYVCLITYDESNELKYIRKGRKLLG